MTPCPEADMTFYKWPCQWYARKSLPPMISTSFVRIGTCLMAKYPQNLSRLTNGLLVRGYNLGSPLWFFTGTVLRSFFMSRSCHFFPKILTTTTKLFLSYYPHIAERSISIIMSHGIISWPGSVERRLWFQECLSASCSTLSGVCVVFFFVERLCQWRMKVHALLHIQCEAQFRFGEHQLALPFGWTFVAMGSFNA